MAKNKMVVESSDKHYFDLDESVAKESGTLKNIIEDGFKESAIPVVNVNSRILSKVIEYLKYHHAAPRPHSKSMAQIMDEFDTRFMDINEETLLAFMWAAHYLDISSLLHLTCKQTADRIKDRSVEEIRKSFNIANDFTPQEEEQIHRETAWPFH